MVTKRSLLISIVILATAAFIACGQGRQVNDPANPNNLPPGVSQLPYPYPGITPYPTATPTATPPPFTGPVPTPPILSDGATAVFYIDGNTAAEQKNSLQQFTGVPLNQIGAVHVNLKTNPNGGVFLGRIKIRFYDIQYNQPVLHEANMGNGTSTGYGNNVHVITTEPATGFPTARFFFEDPWGALIITLQAQDHSSNFSGSLKGHIWYRNFPSSGCNPLFPEYYPACYQYSSNPYNPNAYCWTGIIQTGSFDCRNMSIGPSTSGTNAFTHLGRILDIDGLGALGL